MKRFLWIPILLIMLCLVGCKDNTNDIIDDEEDNTKKVTILYYEDDHLIKSEEYTDTINIYDYSKQDYNFLGWYLDKELTNEVDKNNLDKYFEFESINLYAKMERIMKELTISIIGNIGEEYVANPMFKWDGESDTTYSISLLVNEEIKEQAECNTWFYQFNIMLDANTNYKVLVESKDGASIGNASFKTIDTEASSIKSISLVNPYMDNMVIQRDIENVINGTGPAKELISLSFNEEQYYAVSDESGHFEISLPAHNVSFTPTNLVFSNGVGVTKSLKNVLFGDVYLFAGQSNMQWQTKDSDYLDSDLDSLANTSVRFFSQDVITSNKKMESVTNGHWFVPTKSNVAPFSAIATITASILTSSITHDAPIGIITAYQGDTNIANWMGPEYYNGSCSTKYLHYNAMVYPLRHANLKGVVWYQGCNNSSLGCDYKDLLLDLFRNYRELFGNDKLVFIVIGLACYDGDSGNNFDFSYVRESQALACSLDENAYFISTCDDGDPTYIHPRAKRYICERVAKSIGATFYGKDFYKEGPSFKSFTVKGNRVYIEFNNADGLRCPGKITSLYIAGSDGKYYQATAGIVDGKLMGYSDKVENPVYIKYGFGKSPFVNIYNKDGFAVTPFRTDVYNTNIDLFDYNSIDNYYFHPDGSKMNIEIVDGNLSIEKTNDGKTFGSVRLDKWGAIAYHPTTFRFTIKGTNSGATIAFRAIEGDSYEIWGYKIVDNFEGVKTFEVSVDEFSVMYNKGNNIFEPQKIGYIEIMVEYNGKASFELCEARFVDAN